MKDQNKLKDMLVNAAYKVASKEVNLISSRWPPYCSGVLHQPKRPKAGTDVKISK